MERISIHTIVGSTNKMGNLFAAHHLCVGFIIINTICVTLKCISFSACTCSLQQFSINKIKFLPTIIMPLWAAISTQSEIWHSHRIRCFDFPVDLWILWLPPRLLQVFSGVRSASFDLCYVNVVNLRLQTDGFTVKTTVLCQR